MSDSGPVAMDALWDALWEDLRRNATGRPSGLAIIARHRPAIEQAAAPDMAQERARALRARVEAEIAATERWYASSNQDKDQRTSRDEGIWWCRWFLARLDESAAPAVPNGIATGTWACRYCHNDQHADCKGTIGGDTCACACRGGIAATGLDVERLARALSTLIRHNTLATGEVAWGWWSSAEVFASQVAKVYARLAAATPAESGAGEL